MDEINEILEQYNKEMQPYLRIEQHQGKKDLYNILVIESKIFDTYNAVPTQSRFAQYYANMVGKLNGTKNAIDLSNVEYIDERGFAALLVCDGLNQNNYGHVTLVNFQEQPKTFLAISHFDTEMYLIDSRKEL